MTYTRNLYYFDLGQNLCLMAVTLVATKILKTMALKVWNPDHWHHLESY